MNAVATAPARAAPVTPWRRHLVALGFAALAILLMFARDVGHMATIWWTSSTFNHCLLIVPIIAWLVWQRVPTLAAITPRTWPAALGLVGIGATAWLLGDAAGVSLARHFGVVVMLQGAVATLLGRQVTRALLFPLFYALFLVPAGEELVPALQGVTAQISMALLGLVGIPAHLEGVFITTPGGYFEVAEACSGVKFLVAMFALGVLVAALCFKSWTRRLIFLAAALVVPILANGVRAFATIYVAGETSNEAAASFDHVVYGWFFFAIIIAALMGAAWHFFDRSPGDVPVPPALPAPTAGGATPAWMLALVISLAVVPLLWSARSAERARATHLQDVKTPAVPGWTPVRSAARVGWTPRFAGADHILIESYRDAAGHEVDLAVAVYAWQAEGRELVGFGQGVDPAWSWSEAGAPPPAGRADRYIADGAAREVVTFYRVGDLTTGNDAAVKLATLKARLLGGRQSSVAVQVSSVRGSQPPRVAIDRFLASLGPIEAFAARAVGD